MIDLSESESLCALRSLGPSLVAASRISVIMKRVRGARAPSSRCTVIARPPAAATAPTPPPAPASTASSASRHATPTGDRELAPSAKPCPPVAHVSHSRTPSPVREHSLALSLIAVVRRRTVTVAMSPLNPPAEHSLFDTLDGKSSRRPRERNRAPHPSGSAGKVN